MWYLYLLKCKNGQLYTGITDNLKRRFEEHQSGKGGHYTKYSQPQEIFYSEIFSDRFEAENRESQIKGWSRNKKLALAQNNTNRLRELSKSRD